MSEDQSAVVERALFLLHLRFLAGASSVPPEDPASLSPERIAHVKGEAERVAAMFQSSGYSEDDVREIVASLAPEDDASLALVMIQEKLVRLPPRERKRALRRLVRLRALLGREHTDEEAQREIAALDRMLDSGRRS